jgi:hypothetical protein
MLLDKLGMEIDRPKDYFWDAGYVEDVVKETDRIAAQLARRVGVDDAGARTIGRQMGSVTIAYETYAKMLLGNSLKTTGNYIRFRIPGPNAGMACAIYYLDRKNPVLNTKAQAHEQGHILHLLNGLPCLEQALRTEDIFVDLSSQANFESASFKEREIMAELAALYGLKKHGYSLELVESLDHVPGVHWAEAKKVWLAACDATRPIRIADICK